MSGAPVNSSGPSDFSIERARNNRRVSEMVLKEQLRNALRASGISVSELSRRSGVPKQSLSDWLAGTSPKNIKQVKCVANCLGLSLDALCFGKGASPIPEPVLNVNALFGDDWVSGVFEVRIRKIKK